MSRVFVWFVCCWVEGTQCLLGMGILLKSRSRAAALSVPQSRDLLHADTPPSKAPSWFITENIRARNWLAAWHVVQGPGASAAAGVHSAGWICPVAIHSSWLEDACRLLCWAFGTVSCRVLFRPQPSWTEVLLLPNLQALLILNPWKFEIFLVWGFQQNYSNYSVLRVKTSLTKDLTIEQILKKLYDSASFTQVSADKLVLIFKWSTHRQPQTWVSTFIFGFA